MKFINKPRAVVIACARLVARDKTLEALTEVTFPGSNLKVSVNDAMDESVIVQYFKVTRR